MWLGLFVVLDRVSQLEKNNKLPAKIMNLKQTTANEGTTLPIYKDKRLLLLTENMQQRDIHT